MNYIKKKITRFSYKVVNKVLNSCGLSLIETKNLGVYNSLCLQYAWLKSVETQKPIDSENMEIPWFTFPAIEYLSQIDMRDFDIYEWGSGNSSKFFARRCRSITSIESNLEWFDYGSDNLEENQKIKLLNYQEYATEIDKENMKYDVIIIDGIDRYECAKAALNNIKKGGMIILDNSDWNPNACELLRSSLQYIEVDFHGFGPINSYSWTTSVFIDKNAKLMNLKDRQPHYSKAAIVQTSTYDKRTKYEDV